MLNNILEVSEKKSKGGRVPIKIALHKIHSDPKETNANGIHWKREYVVNAMESANGIPICAEFIDPEEKEVPLGHGLTGSMTNKDGLEEPVYLNSETVGVIESVSINEFENDNEQYEMLVGSGYLFNQRYPKFVQWVRDNYQTNGVETSNPCLKCVHCKAITNSSDQDVIEFDAASHTGVNDIRDIIDSINYAPISSRYKIYIIDEVHMLSNSAFNALLKTLEEPPAHIKFIFATTEIRKVPITILSRCIRFDLSRVSQEILTNNPKTCNSALLHVFIYM